MDDKIEKNEISGACSTYGVRKGVYRVLWRNLRERDHFQSLRVGRIIILKWIFRKCDVGAWTGLIWLRIGTGGGLL